MHSYVQKKPSYREQVNHKYTRKIVAVLVMWRGVGELVYPDDGGNRISEKFTGIHQTTRRHIRQDNSLHSRRCENLISHKT